MAEEAGEIYVQLSADIAELKSGVNAAISELGKFADKADDFIKKPESAWTSFMGNLDRGKAVFAGVAASVAAGGALILNAFGNQQEAVLRLTGALGRQGVASQELVSELEAYAQRVQETTGISDSAVMSSQALLVSYGVQADQLKEVTDATIAFSVSQGVDLQQAVAMVGSAMAGRAMALKRYNIEINQSMTATEKLSAVTKGFASFQSHADAVTKGFNTRLKILWTSVGDVQKLLGALIAGEGQGLIDILIRWTQGIVAFIQNNPGIAKMILTVIGLTGAAAGLLASIGMIKAYVAGPVLAVVAVLTSKITVIVAVLAGIGLTIYALITNFMGLRQSILNIIGALVTLTNPIVLVFQTLFPGVLRTAAESLWAFVESIFTAGQSSESIIGGFLQRAWSWIKSWFDDLITVAGFLVPQSVKDAVAKVGITITGAVDTLKTEFGNVAQAAMSAFDNVKINFGLTSKELVGINKAANDQITAQNMEAMRQTGDITNEQFLAAQEDARKRAQLSEKTYDILGLQQESFYATAKSLSSSFFSGFSNGVADMVMNGRKFSDVMKSLWKDMARQFISAITQMIAKWLVFQAVTGGAGGSFFNAMGGGGGMKWAKGGIIGEPSIVTGLRSGKQALAGEAGPEAVIPFDRLRENNEAVAAQAMSGGNGGGGAGNITINISGQFIDADMSKWQVLIRDKIVPEIERFTMTRPVGPFSRRRGATA